MIVANEILALVNQSKKIVITSHKSPDGDSIGCSLGMYRFLKALGHSPVICHPDPCPAFLEWLKGDDEIIDYENNSESVDKYMTEADLIFCLDYNGAGRVGPEMSELITAATAKKVMIDHHPYPDDIFDISASYPDVCSTAQLIIELIVQSGNEKLLNETIGTPLYLGIVTDTGSFRFSSVTPRTHELIAVLLKSGVNHSVVHERTFDNNRLDRMKLRGFAISEKLEFISDYGVVLLPITEKELERFNYQKGDTEGLVNLALSIEGANVAVLIVEKDGKVKLSFRSLGTIVVNEFAKDHFEGGGHRNAAGGISYISMEETLEKIRTNVPSYFDTIND
ncbi:MAG: phosphoesterase RecJ-like protein [Flavobacteriaceae bacterium]|jgi:phosphoesterase RecJ-like protein